MSAVVVGMGRSRFSRRARVSEAALTVQATTAALRDARLAARDVDGIVRFDRDAV